MLFNPSSQTHLSRLKKFREASYQKLRPYRIKRVDLIRELVGKDYGHGGADRINPVNVILQSVSAYSEALVASNPCFDVSTNFGTLRPYCNGFKLALEEVVKQIDLRATLEEMVVDAMFGLGVVKVGLNGEADLARGMGRFAAMPFADAVGLNNWVHDCNASRWDQIQICGDRYSIPLDEVRENPSFDKAVREKVFSSSRRNIYEQGQNEDPARIGSGTMIRDDQLHDEVRVWDIWLPRDKLLLTMVDEQELPPLKVVEWDGPDRGPYHICAYQKVPGNIMPIPSLYGWYDLHVMVNQLARKLGAQAERQRTVLGYQDGGGDDAHRLLHTEDGEGVKMNNIESVKEFRFGGADQATLAVMLQFRQLASMMAGNLDSLAGLAAGSDTVGQDRLMVSQASQRMKKMQDTIERVVSEIGRDIGSYLWNGDSIIRLREKIQGTSLQVEKNWGQQQRMGSVYQYRVNVIPHSMKSKTPEERAMLLKQIVDGVVAPLTGALQQQGYALDAKAYIKIMSESLTLPELQEIVVPMDPAMQMMGEQSDQPPLPIAAQRQPVTRDKGRPQKDPFLDAARQMGSAQRSNESRTGAAT